MTRLLPGPAGLDSPQVEDGVDAATWNAWLDINADRHNGHQTPIHVLQHALRLSRAPSWSFWWDRQQSVGILTHRAAVVPHPAGETLVSACGYSTPWLGYGVGVAPVGDVPVRDSRRTYCLHCAATVPDQHPGPGDVAPTNPGDLVIPRR